VPVALDYMIHANGELKGNKAKFRTWSPSALFQNLVQYKGKGKAIPLQAWRGPEGSSRLRFPQISRQSAQKGGKVVSPTHRPPLPPGNIPGTHFC